MFDLVLKKKQLIDVRYKNVELEFTTIADSQEQGDLVVVFVCYTLFKIGRNERGEKSEQGSGVTRLLSINTS